MSETPKPALTAEEWAKVAEFPWPDYRYDLVFGLPDQHRDSYRHAHAAVALYGQPFGFDAHDLLTLRRCSEFLSSEGIEDDALDELIAKVRALLPA